MSKTKTFDHQPMVDLLLSDEYSDTFAIGGTLDVPMPTINIEGVGKLVFPVSESQIDTLISVAEQRSERIGGETYIRSSFQDRWHIEANKISISGRGWKSTFNKILSFVTKELEFFSGELDAELDQLLIYKETRGSNVDTETDDPGGVIATLAISLPTSGEGGDLYVTHKREEAVISMSACTTSKITFGAFYSQCSDYILPITSGHRICLIYKLSVRQEQNPTDSPRASRLIHQIADHLNQWKDHGQRDKIVWLLDYSYRREGVLFNTLKGSDAAIARILDQAAHYADCILNTAELCVLKKEKRMWETMKTPIASDDDTDIESLQDVCGHLENWLNKDGSFSPFEEISVFEEEVLYTHALQVVNDTKIWLEDDPVFDNYGSMVVHRLPALVIFPRSRTYDLVLKAGIGYAVAWTIEQLQEISDTEITDLIMDLLERWPKEWTDYEDHNRDGMLHLFAETRQLHLAKNFLHNTVLNHYDGTENSSLATLIFLMDSNTASDFVSRLLDIWIHRRPVEIYQWMMLMTEQLSDAPASWRGLVTQWAKTSISYWPSVLKKCAKLHHDSEAYAQCIEETGDDALFYEDLYTLNHTAIKNILDFAWHLDLVEESIEVAKCIIDFPEIITPNVMLLLAINDLYIIEGFSRSEAYQLLWKHSTDFLLQRSEYPPKKPENWTIDGIPSDTSDLGTELHQFCLNPQQSVKRFKVSKPVRDKIRQMIIRSSLPIRCYTEHDGNPYTLICSKHRVTYEERLREYVGDARIIGVLFVIQPSDIIDSEIQQRVKRLDEATDRFNKSKSEGLFQDL